MIIKKTLKTSSHEELISITGSIAEEVAKSGIKEGTVLVYIPHTTAGITINENADPDVQRDIIAGLRSIGLEKVNYRHSEGNSTGHIKSTLTGTSVNIIIENGRMLLGTWQGIYFCEFDGPRTRNFFIQIR